MRHFVRWSARPAAHGRWRNLDALLEQAGDGETPSDPTGRDDPMLVFFTSGTVSYPKMVLHPQSYALGSRCDRAILA